VTTAIRLGKEGVGDSSPSEDSLRVQKVICCPKRHLKMSFCTVYKRMMGLEPTAFCMANAGEGARPFAALRSPRAFAGSSRQVGERART
jgi:hypothetical protein